MPEDNDNQHTYLKVHETLKGIDPTLWDRCADHTSPPCARAQNPFITYRFLHALEASKSVGAGTGWVPQYLEAVHNAQTIAFAPLYVKTHSQGEYIFDHNWAQAYEHAGGKYYPKLQMAIPYTPVSGPRILCRPPYETLGRDMILQGVMKLANDHNLSSVHMTFCTQEDVISAQKMHFCNRTTQQFHWENPGFDGFNDFLSMLSSRKRKKIRKEREKAHAFGGDIIALTGNDITENHWDAFWQFYQDTSARKWGQPYLTRAFFTQIHTTMRDDILLVMAKRGGRWVAGALNFIGQNTLYGRYWGCTEDHPCLHFEVCYYQAMEYAIAHKLRVEAGAQGGHKLARGYVPNECYSAHWFSHPPFHDSVAQYLNAERAAVSDEIDFLSHHSPFRKPTG